MRRILFKKTYNIRDLGDIPISLKKATKTHQFVRSDALVDLDKDEIKYLKEYGIKVIIDLRNQQEILKRPNILSGNQDFIYISLPFLNETKMEGQEDKPSNDLSKKNLTDIYLDIIENHKKELKAFFELVCKYSNNGILYHCSAGKDRTGIITTLILSLAGVGRLDILADYEVSFTYLLPRLKALQELHKDLPMHIMESKREGMDELLNYINNKYSGAEQYLLSIGLEDKQLEIIKKKIV